MTKIKAKVTIVNRANKSLYATWDGKPYEIPLGESIFDEDTALAIKRQNPIHGSASPGTPDLIYKIGIKELGDPCFPIDTSNPRAARSSIERWESLHPSVTVKETA